MFNVRSETYVPGFRVKQPEDVPGFRVDTNAKSREPALGSQLAAFPDYARFLRTMSSDFLAPASPARYGFPDVDAGSNGSGVTPILVPAPGGGGSGSDRCTLMPGIRQFGMCLYICPDGTVRRSHDSPGPLGCRPWILRNDGLGL